MKGLDEMKLSQLAKGCKSVITGNSFSGNMRRRLHDLGFSEGSEVQCVGESMLSDPRAYLIKGSVFAVRNDDAARIFVK